MKRTDFFDVTVSLSLATGCGGRGSNPPAPAPPTSTTAISTFVDAPVYGLSYWTSTQAPYITSVVSREACLHTETLHRTSINLEVTRNNSNLS